jgi:hypothetical protein
VSVVTNDSSVSVTADLIWRLVGALQTSVTSSIVLAVSSTLLAQHIVRHYCLVHGTFRLSESLSVD